MGQGNPNALKLVKLPENPIWRYNSAEGMVTVSARPGDNLTNERAAWLLDRAKVKLLECIE